MREIGVAGETFGEALANLLDDEDLAGAVKCVRLCHTNFVAEIEYDGPHVIRRFFREADIPNIEKIGEAGPEMFGTMGIRDQSVIGGGLIHQFAIDLNDDDTDPNDITWGRPTRDGSSDAEDRGNER